MEYNANLVQSAWTIMNSSSSNADEKKKADVYLTEFKKSCHFLQISLELMLSPDMNCKIFSAFMINQHIRDIITSLFESKEQFDKIKVYLFNEIMPRLESCPELVIQRICLASAIVVMIGSIKYWQSGIEELVQYAKTSYNQCYYSLTILSNINLEVSSISITQKDSYMIRDQLINKKEFIKDFILNLMNTLPSMDNCDLKRKLYIKTIELVSTWTKFKLNILQMKTLCEIILSQIKSDSIKEISEMFSDSISNTKSAKIYLSDKYENNNNNNALTDQDEMLSLSMIIENIFNFVKSYMNDTDNIKKNDIEDNLLIGIANIFASISENFLYLFFAKNQQSQHLFDILLWFITLNKRKISYKFFETICELREFINSYYKLNNLSEQEKAEFSGYLMKIAEGVMVNCKLKVLDTNYDLKLKNELLYLSDSNHNNNQISNIQLQESVNDIETDSSEVCVTDYRKSADDVFYNIFLILVQNYSSKGVVIFLDKINKILEFAQINNDSIVTDTNRLLAVETVFFIMMSITDSFESLEISVEPIINFTNFILQSKLLENQTMIMAFLLFVDKASPYIQSNKEVYHSTIKFLMTIIKQDKLYEELSSHIMYSINMFAKTIDIDIFQIVYQYYKDNYNNLSKNICSNLALSLCYSVGINSNQSDDEETILPLKDLNNYYSLIMCPASERIKFLFDYISSNNADNQMNQNLINLEIIKNYTIHQCILSHSSTINKELHSQLFSQHFNQTFQTTNAIFSLLTDNSEIIKEIAGIYIKNIEKLKEKSINYFNELNKLMIPALTKNSQNYRCLNVLKLLYCSYAEAFSDKNEEIVNLFFLLCREESKHVINDSKNRIDMLKLYAQFFYYILPHLQLENNITNHINNLNDTILIFMEGMNTYNDNGLLKALIKALSTFISHESLPQEVIREKYLNIISRVFNAIDSYNTTTVTEFEYFISNAIGFDKDLFLLALQNIFTTNDAFKKSFSTQYVQIIFSYFNLFGDNDIKVHRLSSQIVNIKQGKSRLEELNFLGIEIARKQIIKQ